MKVIVYLQGRLGNQLFEVATGYALAKKLNYDLYIMKPQIICGENYWREYDIILNRFNIIQPGQFDQNNLFLIKEDSQQHFIDFEQINFPENKDIMLYGIFQSADYFDNYRADILDIFKISDENYKYIQNKYRRFI